MEKIRCFIFNAEEDQFRQLKDSINANLSFSKFSSYMNAEIPADRMRIYKNLLLNGLNSKSIKELVRADAEISYDSLKFLNSQISKYKKLKLTNELVDLIVSGKTIDEIKEDFYCLSASIVTNLTPGYEKFDVVARCFKYGMSLDQIKYIASKPEEYAKGIAISFLNGKSIKDINKLFDSDHFEYKEFDELEL